MDIGHVHSDDEALALRACADEVGRAIPGECWHRLVDGTLDHLLAPIRMNLGKARRPSLDDELPATGRDAVPVLWAIGWLLADARERDLRSIEKRPGQRVLMECEVVRGLPAQVGRLGLVGDLPEMLLRRSSRHAVGERLAELLEGGVSFLTIAGD